jgi:hypothetical protein
VIGDAGGTAWRLCSELGLELLPADAIESASVVLIDDYAAYKRIEKSVLRCVRNGKTALFLDLPAGRYGISGDSIEVNECGMGARHFVSGATGHRLVSDLKSGDFSFWFDEDRGYISPILSATMSAPGWNPILSSGNGDWASGWTTVLAAAERKYGRGVLRLCQVSLAGRVRSNPVARIFAHRMMEK